MNERAIRAIENYIYELEEHSSSTKKSMIMQNSYSKWAAHEVLRYVKLRSDILPIQAIEVFMDKMNNFACVNRKNSYIFSVAYDIAADILNYLSCSL